MRIAICDDEKHFINGFSAIVSRLYKSLDMIIDEFSSGTQLLYSFQIKPYDIVFLDIEMPEMMVFLLPENCVSSVIWTVRNLIRTCIIRQNLIRAVMDLV